MQNMKIGIYTYGTRGDVQPYIALALGLMRRGHDVVLAAPENFKDFVESFGVAFHPLYGNAEAIMNSEEGQKVLQTENSIKLLKYFYKALYDIRMPLRENYYKSIYQVDYVIANSATLPIVGTIVEKLHKKMALTYFMPPVVPTQEYPLGDFDFINFPLYNRFTYHLMHFFYWQFVKKETNEYRQALGLPILKENLITHINRLQPLDLYCISPSLIPQPKDWASNHKITGFMTIPIEKRKESNADEADEALKKWLREGEKPIYIGFGSNGVGNQDKFIDILTDLLHKTKERILFCTGWSQFKNLPQHHNLFTCQYVNHELILPQCKIGIFHGGAGTLAAMLRHDLPSIIISFYTDQPTWGKIIEKKKLGIHIPFKKLTTEKLLYAIEKAQTPEIKENAMTIGKKIRGENGLENALNEIEKYFNNGRY